MIGTLAIRQQKNAKNVQTSERSKNLYGQGVQTLRYEILQRIIHKPVLRHAAFSGEDGCRNAHAKVRPHAAVVRASVACMCGALVDHFELGWLEPAAQTLSQGLCRGGYGVHRALMPWGYRCPWVL